MVCGNITHKKAKIENEKSLKCLVQCSILVFCCPKSLQAAFEENPHISEQIWKHNVVTA